MVTQRQIPLSARDLNLNLRAFVEMPNPTVSLEQELKGVFKAVERGTFNEQDFITAVTRIVGRELDALEQAVISALPTSRVAKFLGEE